MANRYSSGCQCCQEAGCSGCVDRYLTSVTVEVGSEVLSIPVNQKIADLTNCEINYTLCGDETEVTVLDYSIDHAWDGRNGCWPGYCEGGAGGGGEGGGAGIGFGGPTPSFPSCVLCQTQACNPPGVIDYQIRTYTFDNLQFVLKVKYQVRYGVTLKFLSGGSVEVYVAVQLYYRVCSRYSFENSYYVNTGCPLEDSDCGIMDDPDECNKYVECDGTGMVWELECGPLERCESDGITNEKGQTSTEAEVPFHCCTHEGCAADTNLTIEGCSDPTDPPKKWFYYNPLPGLQINNEFVAFTECPSGSMGRTEGACNCNSGNDGWYAQSEFRGSAVLWDGVAADCTCPSEFQLSEESRCVLDDCSSLGRQWPNVTYTWTPCIIAACVAIEGIGPIDEECCLDTAGTPAPTTINLTTLDPGSTVYVTLNCT